MESMCEVGGEGAVSRAREELVVVAAGVATVTAFRG